MTGLLFEVLAAVAWGIASLRWLRVAQREHYIPWSVGRFAVRWWIRRPPNQWLAALAVAATVATAVQPAAGLVAAVMVAAGPLGLGLRGRTSRLAWTARLKRLAGIHACIFVVLVLVGQYFGAADLVAVLLAVAAPFGVDLACAVAAPVERRLSSAFVRRAAERVRSVAPRVVAITGSYGKTTTKGYVRDLLSGVAQVVTSPASFNNRLGLARSVNEHLTSGTDIFVAEMGTYGKGEIADLCTWLTPSVAVLTAIGPVHLERFGSLDAIADAKAEIVERADVAVVNADEPLIIAAVERHAPAIRLVRCSTLDPDADVYVHAAGNGLAVQVHGEEMGVLTAALFPMNVACALGVAVALDIPLKSLSATLPRLRNAPHRQDVVSSEAGVAIIDDTYNANPRGAAAALERLTTLGAPGHRRVVVTPGMVELGRDQAAENERFAAMAAAIATDLVFVGSTNRAALLAGADSGRSSITTFPTRNAAVAWVRAHLGAGDAVLYENDLPDHYP